ncbi:MAG: phage tail tape measure protein [Oscillospiraceae bacterium]|nr:phage tail tape measure protein [Oscillospiraceae bacterium]
MATRKEYEMLFALNAQMGSSFNSTFSKAQQQLVGMQRELKELSERQSDIAAYEKQQGAAEATQKKLETLQAQYDNVKREIGETGTYSSALENKLLSTQLQIDKTSDSLETKTQKLTQMEAALQGAGVRMDNLGKASAELGGQIEQLKHKQEEAADAAGRLGDSMTESIAAASQAFVASGIANAAKEVFAVFSDSADVAMDFEKSMSSLEAILGATSEEMNILKGTASEAGRNMIFNAEEIAGSYKYMAVAGEDASRMLDSMNGIVNLAQGSNIDLARSAEIVADSMEAFGLSAKYTDHFVNVLAATTNVANTEVGQIGEGFKYFAPVASALNFIVEDTALAFALMANNGIKGSQAGTTLRGAMTNLANPAKKAAAEMDRLGISIENQDGSMKSLEEIIYHLQDRFDGLTEKQQAAAAATIFGKESMSGMLSVIRATEKQMDDAAEAIYGADKAFGGLGAAAGMANTATDNARSALIIMNNASNDFKMAVGEALTPAIKDLANAGADAFRWAADFARENPAVVKAVTVFTGVIVTATGALAAYTVVSKAVRVMNVALAGSFGPIMAVTAAFAGLAAVFTYIADNGKYANEEVRGLSVTTQEQYCKMKDLEREYNAVVDAGEELSVNARMLKRDLDDATDAFKNNRQTAEEAAEAQKRFVEACAEIERARDELLVGVDKEGRSTKNLVDRLEELVDADGKVTGSKQEMLAIIDMLNEAMPELGLSYDEQEDQINRSVKKVRELTEAEIARKKHEANQDALKTNIKLRDEWAENEIQNAKDVEVATDLIRVAREKYYEVIEAGANDEYTFADDYNRALSLALIQIQEAEEALAEQQEEWEFAVEKANEYKNVVGNLSEEIAKFEVQDAISIVTGKVEALTEAYYNAYVEAHKSIIGQYKLWDDAAEVIAVSAGEINKALESQAKYWQDYNKNLAGLSDRTGDIEGLSEMISSFADGNKDSVNAVAGMAKASDADLKKMVANWQKLQEEQELVAGSLAKLEVDFDKSMEEIQKSLEESIENMDLSEEAARKGRLAIEAFIDGAEGQLPAVQAAYKRIADAANAGLAGYLSPRNRPSTAGGHSGTGYANYIPSHADGLDYVPFDGYIAELHKNERVLTAEANKAYTEYLMVAPPLMAAMFAVSAAPRAVGAELSSGGSITFAPQYHFAGNETPAEVQAVFDRHDDSLREMFFDFMEDYEADKGRRRY